MTFAQPFQDYEILDRVGAGAMGTVFKARQKRLNRIVALKVLKPSLARDTRYVDRLRREARIVASLNHPNIVTGYDLGEEGGYHFFVMEFVEGKSLRALLVEWGMFAEEYVRRVARQVALALDHAYQRGVIHRDIKPGNILIDERGEVKLTDMGLAKGPADLTLTRDGATVGTPQYISPEQARSPQDVDVRSDLYSLGATLYHMATGVPPFRGDTMAELITKVLSAVPVPPNEVNPALSEGMSLVLRKLLAKDLRVRYQTPRELLDDLDRVERQLPPEVDLSRLTAGEGGRVRYWWRAVAVVAGAALLALALWVGMQLRQGEPAPPTADEFLARLDSTLAELPTPAARLQHLRLADVVPPPGCEVELLQRERVVIAALQSAVDGVVAAMLGEQWPELAAWLRDPLQWPDRQRCERERIAPRLRDTAGVELGQLPPQVRTLRLDELLARVDRELVQRDQELLRRFETHLESALPARVDERVRAGDFAAAERLWRDAIGMFFDGVRQPLPERLSGVVAQRVTDLVDRARRAALPDVAAAEAAVAAALGSEVDEVAAGLGQQLRAGDDPELVAAAAARFRQDLAQVWPPPGRFRIGQDPWPGIERRLGALQQEILAATAKATDLRFERRCDLVWRTFCQGSADDALSVLAGTEPTTPAQAERLRRHQEALAAARAVERAVLAAIARCTVPVVAFPHSGLAQAVELRAEPAGDTFRLTSQRIGQPARAARLGEFRFTELVAWLRQHGIDALRAVPPAQLSLGTVVVSLAGDELVGVGELVAELERDGDRFVGEQIWPRVIRVREERPDTDLDRESLLAGLRRAREAAAQAGALNELEAAILTLQSRVSTTEMSDRERGELRSASSWLHLERRRRQLLAELRRGAPAGAETDVVAVGDRLDAEVVVAGAALHRDAAEGWNLRDGLLEFAGGDRPWSDLPSQALRCTTGMDGRAERATLLVDLVLPTSAVGRRHYVIGFRGIAMMLVVTADDAVHAAVVDGDPLREELAQRAYERALQGALQPARALAVPGAAHRLSIDVKASPTRRRASVTVDLDGVVLIERELHDLPPQQGLDVVVYPRQELAVARVAVRAVGL
ncbi:MAG: protein kinase [Planctomycetes bacterium]|nr:protein kinase [Planctomycetota bacterium]